MELDTPCTVTNPPAPVSETVVATDQPGANERTITLATASGKPGDEVTVTGAEFTPLTGITVVGRAGAAETADRTTVTSDAAGDFTATLAVSDPATTGIVAYEGGAWNADKGAGPAAYTVIDDTPLPENSQKLNASVAAGTLSMSQAGDTVELSAVDFGRAAPRRGDLQNGDGQGLPRRTRGLVPDRQGHRLHGPRRHDRRRPARLDPGLHHQAGQPEHLRRRIARGGRQLRRDARLDPQRRRSPAVSSPSTPRSR